VDDLVTFTNSPAESDHVERELKQKFEIKTLGEPSLLLGMKFTRNKENQITTLSQAHYIDKIIQRVGLQDTNPVSTPLDPNVNLEIDEAEQDKSGNDREFDHDRASGVYARAIGSLMYAAIGTRPDIAYAVHTMAKFTQSKHWTAIKRIFRYLKGTRDFHLTYGGLEHTYSTELSVYCDADWASSSDRKSISGYVFLLGGGAVSWSSKKQATVALSTAEAEYVAATHAAKQILWHRALFDELEIPQPQPETSILFTDNQAPAIAISHHPEFHARTKHIDIAHHFLRDLIESGTIETTYIQTRENLADVFTKGLPRPLHQDLTYGIGVLSNQGGVLE
jgi:Reverse transcriptase (RNA-dependent DNA polymerase)